MTDVTVFKKVIPSPSQIDKNKYSCEQCGKKLTRSGLSRHKKAVHEGVRYFCDLCQKEFKQSGGLSKHLKVMHPSADLTSFEKISAKTMPSAMTEEPSFPCDQCDGSFSSSKDLMAHNREAVNHEAICKACDTTFKNFDNMRHHKRKYHQSPVSEFDCDSCGITLKTRDILKAHWDYMHKVESGLNCNLCGRICQNLMKLRKHTMTCLTRDPDIVAQEWLQVQASDFTKYQTFGNANSAEGNTSGFDTNSLVEMDEKPKSVSYYGGEAGITSLPYDSKLEKNIDSINIEEEFEFEELVFDVGHLAETYSKDDSKGEERVELNKMDELEGLGEIERPDIDCLVEPVKRRKKSKIPVVAKACTVCGKEVKYLYQHMRDIHELNINGLVTPARKKRKRNKIPVVEKACPICGKELKYLYQHMRDLHPETLETEPDINGLVAPVKKRRKRERNNTPPVAKVCPVCAREVKWLSGHIKDVHTESDENHVCNECGKVFSKRKKLRGHFDAVHKVKPSMCDICTQVFKNEHALRGHKMKVHTIEHAKCQVCGSNFKNKILMKNHLRLYHKELFDEIENYIEI